VGLWDASLKKQVFRHIHYLVLTAFVGLRPEGMEVCHCNGNNRDNRVSNLRWDTPKGNHSDAVRAGTHTGFTKHGENNNFAKLTNSEVLSLRRLYHIRKYSLAELGLMFSTSPSNVSDIVNRKTWTKL